MWGRFATQRKPSLMAGQGSCAACLNECSYLKGSGYQRGWSRTAQLRVRVAATPGSSSTVERTSVIPTRKESSTTSRKKPPMYKVLLHNDNYNRREYVVKVLLKVVDCITVDDAVNVMQEAHTNGLAMVIACGQDEAEGYVEGLRLNGLVSTLEP